MLLLGGEKGKILDYTHCLFDFVCDIMTTLPT